MNQTYEEQAVLGSILFRPELLPAIGNIIEPDDFEQQRHKRIFWAMLDLECKDKPIDEVTIGDRLKSSSEQKFVECGGYAYLAELIDYVPSSGNASEYARIIKDKSNRRKAKEAVKELDTADIEHVAAKLGEIAESASEESRPEFTHEIIPGVVGELEAASKREGAIPGIPTGFADLDNLILGLNAPDLIILAARPSMGKTSKMLDQILSAAKAEPNKTAIVFSMEMSKEQLVLRLISKAAKVEVTRMRLGDLTAEEWDRVAFACDSMPRNILIDDRPALSPNDIRNTVKNAVKSNPVSGVWVDYLQLMEIKGLTEQQMVTQASKGLKSVAKKFSIPVVALSQLNRNLESRNNKRPVMSDLRESGAIEQDADIILFIYRDEVYNEDSADKGIAEVIVSKNRHGEIKTIRLEFRGRYMQFLNLTGTYKKGEF